MFGRMLSERLGIIHFGLTFVGVYCIFIPMHLLGMGGSPRRYAMLTDDFLLPTVSLHRFITVAALATGAAQFVFLFNLFWSVFRGERAGANPWSATSLEWVSTTSPEYKDGLEQPVLVSHGPYDYGETSTGRDFVVQSDAPEVHLKS
ncbi:MAG TPA: cbb3-type cytochrome c oxidase subunit I, partial [Terriglobales bacterium]|nr:cbb3-type cytochrome c oxidase subunit I [Terriglobales bacterium]